MDLTRGEREREGERGGGRDRQAKSFSMSFDTDAGDIGLERRQGGHSCVTQPPRWGGGVRGAGLGEGGVGRGGLAVVG